MTEYVGTSGNDLLIGDGTNDVLIANGGRDTIRGGGGDDTVSLNARFLFGSIFDGGGGFDRLQVQNFPNSVITPTIFSPAGIESSTVSLFGLAVTGFEQLAFATEAGKLTNVLLAFGGGNPDQIAAAFPSGAELVGSIGYDTVSLIVRLDQAPLTITAPTFTYSGWQTPDRAYQPGDWTRVIISTGPNPVVVGDLTVNGSAHAGVQFLNGNKGNDTLNGSADMDFLDGGAGVNVLHGNGGDDALALINYTTVTVTGGVEDRTTAHETGAGSLFDGGEGKDFLVFGGDVTFLGTVTSIEGIDLAPAFGYAPGAAPTGALVLAPTVVHLTAAALASFAPDLEFDGSGTVVITTEPGVGFDGSAFTFTAGAQVVLQIDGADGDQVLTGSAAADFIAGGAGNDTLAGGGGDDLLTGDGGADLFLLSGGGDTITDFTGGEDRIDLSTLGLTNFFQLSPLLAQSGNDVVLTSTLGTLTLRNTVLEQLVASDFVFAGNPGLYLEGTPDGDLLTGTSGDDTILGADGADTILTGGGTDLVDAGAGDDRVELTGILVPGSNLAGGADNDTLVITAAAGSAQPGSATVVTLGTVSGFETIAFASLAGEALSAVIDAAASTGVTLVGGAGTDRLELILAPGTAAFTAPDLVRTDWAVDDTLAVSAAALTTAITLDTGDHSGIVALIGGTGDDTLIGSAGVEVLSGGAGNDTLTGLGGADTLNGGAGNDFLNGSTVGAASNVLAGGSGDDRNVLFQPGDTIVELAGEGFDTLELHFNGNFSLAALPSVEAVQSFATSAVLLTGNDSNNLLTGSTGNDTLVGGLGNDTLQGLGGINLLQGGEGSDLLYGSAAGAPLNTLVGGAGNDRYFLAQLGDTITETAGGGTDEVHLFFNANFSLTNRPEIESVYSYATVAVTLTGNNSANVLSGSIGNDTIAGGLGDDTLIGGAGNDSMTGGQGNDVYYVDSLTDLVIEVAGAGTDEVRASTAGYSLAKLVAVENLTGSGLLTGNALANVLTGGNGNDTLDGSAGADTLRGGLGDDLYLVDNIGDVLFDTGGLDTVRSKVSWALGTGFENLELLLAGTATGNDAANRLTGSTGGDALYGLGGNDTLLGGAGNDLLDGGTGNDTMTGGAGNDTFVVDSAGDSVDEVTGGGIDIVLASIAKYTLTVGVENLTYTGSADFAGTGNNLANQIIGGSGNDVLAGSAGNDTLIGGEGNDTLNGGTGADLLIGGAGNDTYLVDSVNDVIVDASGNDTVITSVATYTLADGLEGLTYRDAAMFTGTGNAADNTITSAGGNDILSGAGGDDTLAGGNGNDQLLGGDGNDSLLGGAGNDTLVGGLGRDMLTGGAGLDLFGFTAAADSLPGSDADQITDFLSGQDKLDFTAIDTSPEPGRQGFTFVAGVAFSATGAAEIRYDPFGSGFIVQADLDGDGLADMAIVLTVAAGPLTAGDFLL